MQNGEKRNSIGHLSVLTGLWAINLTILFFGIPFLIYKKLQESYIASKKKSSQKTKAKSARYFPCHMDL